MRLNDSISAISHGMTQELTSVLTGGIEVLSYVYIYRNWRIITLPTSSWWTWIFCLLLIDFAYYVMHRASHEINVLWAVHQLHHSGEDLTPFTTLRQAAIQSYAIWVFYIPLAFLVPPPVFLAFIQFHYVHRYWVHNSVVGSLGIAEYVMNTPSHHRVHHGRNKYCIDKNYAAILIIWDRMFGTFAKEEDKVVFGLTHPLNTFSVITAQTCHFKHMYKTFKEVKGLGNKLSVIFKGPGWSPGKPRLGNMDDIPEIEYPVKKYDPKLPFWCNVYILLHFGIVFLDHMVIMDHFLVALETIGLTVICYQVFSIIVFGALLDGREYAPQMELLRCVLYFLVHYYNLPRSQIHMKSPGAMEQMLENFTRVYFVLSATFWAVYCHQVTSTKQKGE